MASGGPRRGAERGKRDRVRWAAWSATAAVCAALLCAGFVRRAPDVDTLVSCGALYARLGMNDEARAQLEEALRRDGSHAQANLLLALLEQAEGRHAAALARFAAAEQAVLASGDEAFLADYYVATGLSRLATADFAGAERDALRLQGMERRRAAGFVIQSFSRLGAGDDTGFQQGIARAYTLDHLDPIFRLRGEFISEAIPWAAAFSIGG
ncbi:MAG: hypothetical protein HY812_21790 [Planctomycetes bacterium]|nr:hypothetical protein [Planctomycetota bacterium]